MEKLNQIVLRTLTRMLTPALLLATTAREHRPVITSGSYKAVPPKNTFPTQEPC